MKSICYVYFTFGREFAELMLSIRSVVATAPKGYVINIYVYDDGDNAFTDEQISELMDNDLDIFYEQTFWDRCGNLRGQDHLIHAVEIYNHLCQYNQVLVKVDSDTVLINQDWIKKLAESEKKVSGGFFKNQPQYLWGPAYALRGDLSPLLDDCKKFIAHGQCFEDYEIGMRLSRIYRDAYKIIDRYQVMRDGFFQGEILEQTVSDVDKFMNLRVATLGFAKSEANYPYRMNLMMRLVEKLEAKQKEEKGNEEK